MKVKERIRVQEKRPGGVKRWVMLPAIVSLSIAAGVFFGKRYFVQELFFFVGLTALLVFIGANVVVIGFLFHKAVQSVSRSVRTAKPNYAPRDESVREGLFAAPPIPSGERADTWFYFTEDELSPGAARVDNFKAVFNLRGDGGQATGGLAVDSNLGWKGAAKYVATVPQLFDLWQDPQERYDVFMNNYTEQSWTLVSISAVIKDLMKTYLKYPPRKLQSMGYTGPLTISQFQRFQYIRDTLEKEGINIPLPTGN